MGQARFDLFDKQKAPDKEIIMLEKPASFPCPDDSQPLFTINVTKQNRVATCYYCSKTWQLYEQSI